MMEASELIERLEKATGSDREIDGLIVKALCPGALLSQYLVGDDEPSVFHAQALGIADKDDVPRYTASLDAALSLVERVLPGFAYGLRTCAVWAPHHQWAGKPVWEAVVTDMGDCDCYYPWGDPDETDDVVEHEASHCSPALALCLALLRASPTEEPKEDRT